MAIIFRPLNEEEKEILHEGLKYWLDASKIKEVYTRYSFFVGEGRWKEVFITNKKVTKIMRQNPSISPYSIGLGFGEFRDDGIILSLSGASLIASHTNRLVKVNEKAERLFLYRRNIQLQPELPYLMD